MPESVPEQYSSCIQTRLSSSLERGNANYATRNIEPGEVVLSERPVVVAQRLLSSRIHGGVGIRCCAVCLTFVDVSREIHRLVKPSPLEEKEDGADHVCSASKGSYRQSCFGQLVRLEFCSEACWAEAIEERGFGYLLEAEEGNDTSATTQYDMKLELEEKHEWQVALHRLAEIYSSYNERVLQVTQVLCKLMLETRATSNASTSRDRFGDLFRSFVDGYAEGGHQPMNDHQRGVIRQAHAETVTWLRCCWISTFGCLNFRSGANRDEIDVLSMCWTLPVQEYLQLCWLLDANVHSCVIINPIWLALRNDDTCNDRPSNHAKPTSDMLIRADEQTTRDIQALLHCLDAHASLKLHKRIGLAPGAPARCEDGMGKVSGEEDELPADAIHNMGVALYRTATKFNHSCDPSVRFVPTVAPARAVVIARRQIEVGEELLTSYIDLSDTRFSCVKERRRELQSYGFVCDCPRCNTES